MTVYSRQTTKSTDWFVKNTEELTPFITRQGKVLEMYKSCPCQENFQALRAAQGVVQKEARRCANDYWLDLCARIQLPEDNVNTRAMYDGIKKALGPTPKKSAPHKSSIGEIIQD